MTTDRFLPERAPLDSYGNGGFRFSEMGHRGSLLILESGMHAWPVTDFANLTLSDLAPVLSAADRHEFLLLGTGAQQFFPSADIREAFAEAGLGLDAMDTGAAARTYNVLLAEERAVAAALIAVD